MEDLGVKVGMRVTAHRGQRVEGLVKLSYSSRKKRWICWQRWSLSEFKAVEEERRAHAEPLAQGAMAVVRVHPTLGMSVALSSLIVRKEITKNEGVTKEITRQNVAGKAGPGGKAGEPSEAKPVNGTDGTDGYANIFIQKPDGNFDGPFPSAYKLEVVEFEVVDGNEDGILEFGEDIVLRNIRVRNSGSCTKVPI